MASRCGRRHNACCNRRRPPPNSARPVLHLRCPHCHNPIEVVDETPLSDLTCPSCGSQFSLISSETTCTHQTGTRVLGHFELLEEIGIGHFGSVWKARDSELDRTVAIKIPRQGQLDAGKVRSFCATPALPPNSNTPTSSASTRSAATGTRSTSSATSSRARISRSGSPVNSSPPARRPIWSPESPRPCTMPTRRASCIATSSRATS